MILLENFLIAFVLTAIPLFAVFGRVSKSALTTALEALIFSFIEVVVFVLLQLPTLQQLFAVAMMDLIFIVFLRHTTYHDHYHYDSLSNSNKKKGFKATQGKIDALVIITLLAITIVFPITIWTVQATASNATYLQNQVTTLPGTALFANETLPIGAVPLVTVDYARQIAQSHMSRDFGGSAQIVDHEQIVYDHAPYWVFTIASTNTFSQNFEKGFILVNAVNGSYIEVQQQTAIGPGLCGVCFSSIGVQTWLRNTNVGIGNWYPQPVSGGKILYVETLDQPGIWGATTFAGGIVYNPDGSVNTTYSSVSNAPSYVNQPWDRQLLVSIAGQWASARTTSGESWCSWGCFFGQASTYRLQLATDGNYSYELIPYHNGTAVMLFFSPANSQRSLSGVMVASGSNITYYNLSSFNYISPSYAQSQVHSEICQTTVCSLHATQPILYPVNGQFVYITPVYYQDPSTGNYVFDGVGVTGAAQNGATVYVHGTDPTTTRDAALSQYFNGIITNTTTITTTINGTVQATSSYIQNGNSVIALKVNGTWYTASPPSGPTTTTTGSNSTNLSFDDWYTIQNIQVGQQVTLTVRGTAIVAIKAS